jgi:hypothetical protein
MREAASVGGLFHFDLDFSVSAVGDLKTITSNGLFPVHRLQMAVA